MALDILQSKNAVAQVISVTILYHWLRLHKFPSPTLFFLSYPSFSSTPPLLSSALLLESWNPLFLSISPASECLSYFEKLCLLFRTLAFLLNTNPCPLLFVINRLPFCLLFPPLLTYTPYLADSIRFSVMINLLLPSLP